MERGEVLVDLSRLTEITYELAREVKDKDYGSCFQFVTFLLDNINSHIVILDKDYKVIFANKFARDKINIDFIGKTPVELGMCETLDCEVCPISKSMIERKVISNTFKSKSGGLKSMLCMPLVYNGSSGVIVIIEDKK